MESHQEQGQPIQIEGPMNRCSWTHAGLMTVALLLLLCIPAGNTTGLGVVGRYPLVGGY